jgi:beta-N-acetylhexosaminidase
VWSRRRPEAARNSGTVRLAIAAVAVVACVTACSVPAPAPTGSQGPSSGRPSSGGPTATVTPSPTGTGSEDSCVAATLTPMSLDQLVGQVMLVGTPLDNPAGVDATLTTYHLGGVFLAGRSHDPAATLRAAISALQARAPATDRLLIALDQEGGEVQTLQGPDFPPIPTAVAQGKLSQSTLRTQTTAWANRLAGIGVTLDLAPVADTVPASLGTGNPPIGAYYRQYGSDPTAVAADISTVVGAVQTTGVLTTLKHFPGLGRVTLNTDTSTGAVDTTATTHDPYLAPFQAGIKAGTGAVMISSARYPNIDADNIAAFSGPVITDLLRGQLGFTGLVVSDDLGNAVAVRSVPVADRAVRFIDAGGDMALTVSASTAEAMIGGLLSAARGSSAFAAKVTEAARHVLRAKYRAGLLGCSPRP